METDIRLSLSLSISVAAVIVRFTYLTITREGGGGGGGREERGSRTNGTRTCAMPSPSEALPCLLPSNLRSAPHACHRCLMSVRPSIYLSVHPFIRPLLAFPARSP